MVNSTKITIFILVCIHIWFLYLLFAYPSFGINVESRPDGTWVISRFDRVMNELGLQIGDRIDLLDGVPAGQFPSVVKLRTIDQAHTIVVSRSGVSLTFTTKHIAKTTEADYFALCGELVSLSVAYLFYRKLPRSASARRLAQVFACIGLTFMSLLASIRGDALAINMIGAAVMLLPVSFLQFLIVFLREKAAVCLPSSYVPHLYGFIAGLFILQLTTFINAPVSYLITHCTTLVLESFVVCIVLLNAAVLAYAYARHRRTPHVAALLKTIGAALLVSFAPLIGLSFVPEMMSGVYWINPFYTGWFVLFFPAAFAYLIARRQLYDIDFILKRMLFTTLIAVLPCAVFLGIVALLFPDRLTARIAFIAFFLFLLAQSLIFYSFEYLTSLLEPVIFPRKHYLQQALKKIAGSLGTTSSFRELKRALLADLVGTLDVFGGAVAYRYNDRTDFVAEGDIGRADIERALAAEGTAEANCTVLKVSCQEEYACFLVLTAKKDNTLLSREETQWLRLIVTYLAVTMENVHLMRKLTASMEQALAHLPDRRGPRELVWFRKLTFELQEKERMRIAADLHDTTMQDLFFLRRKLAGSLRGLPAADRTRLAPLQQLVADIDTIHSNLRQSCFELHPFLMNDIGLVRTVEQLVRLERETGDFRLQFRCSLEEELERREPDVKMHLFRIVQELLNNAKKHSRAHSVKLHLAAAPGGSVALHYEDDGIGFVVPAVFAPGAGGPSGAAGGTAAAARGPDDRLRSQGLEQLRSRVASLDGRCSIDSAPGAGVTIHIAIPANVQEGESA